MTRTIRATVLGALLLGAAEAQAGVNGAACTPGDPAIQSNRYLVVAGSVNYQPGASGLVTLYCPATIPTSCPSPHFQTRLTYTDSDGGGSAVSVTAQLLRLSTANGTFLGLVPNAQPIASNASETTTATSQISPPFGFFFKEKKEYYYFRVDMNRAAGTSHVATVYGVGLECAD